MTAVAQLFRDITVVEAASVLAGPSVGMFFAELGARVIKIENPRAGGDITRRWKLPEEPPDTDISAYFSCVNWGKKSIGIDIARPEGRAVVMDLIRKADIFLQSYKPGDEKKFNLDYASARAVNNRLIYAHITAYGPDDDRTGFDAVLQAETGFTGINGEPEGGPVKMPVALIDLLLAHQLKQALLLALMERQLTGKGSYTTVSLYHSALASLANQAANYLVGRTVPRRSGSDHPNIAPYGAIFRTRDGHDVVLAIGTDAQFVTLCETLGLNALADDDRFRTNVNRVRNREALKQILSARLACMDRAPLLETLRARRTPAGAVLMMDEVFQQEMADEMVLDDGKGMRGVRSVAFRTDILDTRKTLGSPPSLSQDALWILRDVLEYPEEEVARLKKTGVIG